MQIKKCLHKSRQSVHCCSTKNIYIRNSVGDFYFNKGNARFVNFCIYSVGRIISTEKADWIMTITYSDNTKTELI